MPRSKKSTTKRSRKTPLLESYEDRILCSVAPVSEVPVPEEAPPVTSEAALPLPESTPVVAAQAPQTAQASQATLTPDATVPSATETQQKSIQDVVRESTNEIWFQENVGQFDADVQYGFKTRFGAMLVYSDHLRIVANQTDPETGAVGLQVIDLTFDGANTDWTIVTGGESEVVGSYQNGDGTSFNPRIFKELTLRNVYNGVDLRLYSAAGTTLEFDWLVSRAADYTKIAMNFEGQDGIIYNADGSSTLDLRFQDLALKMPEVYQIIDGAKVDVSAAMVAGNEPGQMRYAITGLVDENAPLVIDPNVVWSTYFDLNDSALPFDSYLFAVNVNANGTYAAGWVREIITNGSFGGYMQVNAGFSVGTVANQTYIYRLSNDGLNITAWTSTGITSPTGGVTNQKLDNQAADLELFPDGRVVVGFSHGVIQIYSANLATRSYNAEPVTMDTLNAVAIVSNDVFYVGGRVAAAIPVGEIAAVNIGPDATFAGPLEGVVVRFGTASTTPTASWATYVGGSASEYFTSVNVTPDKTKIVFATSTASTAGFPALVNAVDAAVAGTELVVGVLNEQATVPAAFDVLSFLGGTGDEGTVATDTMAALVEASNTHFWVAGTTNSTNVPGSAGGAQAANGGGTFDAFVSRIPLNGSAGLGFQSTYLGGDAQDRIGGMAFDMRANRLLIFGTTGGGTFPVLNTTPASNYFDGTFGGGTWDIYVATFTPDLLTKDFATFIGGSANDYLGQTGELIGQGHVVYSDATGLSYLATTVHSTDIPASVIGTPPGKDDTKSNVGNDSHIIFAFNINIFDYGDAPATYENSSLAREAQSANLRIGTLFDTEATAGSSVNADGDDALTTDDEDGIATVTNIAVGAQTSYSSTVSVFNNTGVARTLQAWMDFNRDGLFQASERTTVNVPTNAAQQNVVLTWATLPALTTGQTYMRLRLSDNAIADNAGTPTVDERSIGTGNFGEIEDYSLIISQSSLAGTVYRDLNNNGAINGGETGITGVTVTLTGTNDIGGAVNVSVVTDASGNYSFANIRPSNGAGYTITETQPAGFLDGLNTLGTAGGVAGNPPPGDAITGVVIGTNVAATGYLFGELPPSSLSGTVYRDLNNNGAINGGETGIVGVTVTLTGTNDLGAAINTSVLTDASGNYSFANLRPGTYTLTETQPAGFFDGRETVGTQASGTVVNTADSQTISNITLASNTTGSGNLFGELPPSSLAGSVYSDYGGDGVFDAFEIGIPGATVTLTGTDDRGNAVSTIATTPANGAYSFTNLRPGTYTLTETQPAGYADGIDTQGTPGGGTLINDAIQTIPLLANTSGAGNNFGESPTFGLTKSLQSTNVAATTGSNVTLGEIATFRLVATIPAGSFNSFVVQDALPAGYQFINGTAVASLVSAAGQLTSSTLSGAGLAQTSIGTPTFVLPDAAVSSLLPSNNDTYNSGTDVFFKFGNLTNTDTSGATTEAVVIEFQARVVNELANQAGINLDNTFSVLFEKTGAGDPDPHGTPSNTITTTVAEPNVTVTKGASPAGPVDAGDVITYTLTLTNPGGANSSTAFDTLLVDTMPSHLLVTGITSTTLAGGATTDSAAAIGGGGTNITGQYDIPAGGSIVIVYTATVQSTLPPNATLVNSAVLTWTSLNGGNSTAPDANERFGAAGSTFGDGSLNDFRRTTNASTPGAGPVFSKVLFSTSDAGTTGSNVGIGETVTYGLLVTLPEGTTSGFNALDTLPAGLAFVSSSIVTTVAASNGFLTANFNGTVPAPTVTQPGGNVNFAFGAITTTGDNVAGNNTFLILVNTVVTDVVGNVGLSGSQTTLNNSATFTGTGIPPTTPPPVGNTVVEPRLQIVKGVDDTSADLGQVLNYSLTITHTASSTQTAYDLILRDAIPAGLTLNVASIAIAGGTIATNTSTAALLALTVDQFAVGGTITITYTATVGTGAALVGTNQDNNARMFWDSLADDAGSNAVFTGVADGTNDRDFGPTPGYTEAPTPAPDDLAQDTQRVTINANTISGNVYADADASGTLNGAEVGINNVTVTLNGTTFFGAPYSQVVTTNASGVYTFTNVPRGTYTITETQPAGFIDGVETVGTTFGGTVNNAFNVDTITGLTVPAGVNSGTGYNFGELLASSLAGTVYRDLNNNGAINAGETGITGVNVALTGTDVFGQAVSTSAVTPAAGTYSFTSLRPGTYTLTETQPAGFFDGRETVGTQASGTIDNAVDSNTISTISLTQNVNGTGNLFGELPPSSLSGSVYADYDGDGVFDAFEIGIPGATVTLTGTDDRGNAVSTISTTLASGAYTFTNLRPGSYTLTETQPSGYTDGIDTQGTPGGGTAINDAFQTIPLASNTSGAGNNFGESPNIGLTKSLQATNVAATTGNNVTLGEIATFRLVATIPAGTFNSFVVQDALPAGYQFINGTAVASLVSAAGQLTSSTLSGAGLAQTSIGTPTFVLPDAAVSSLLPSNNDTYNSGTDVFFKIGNLTNTDTSGATTEAVVIEFQARVVNELANQAAINLSNTFSVLFEKTGAGDPDPHGTPSTPVITTVAEPVLTFDKSNNGTGTVSAGDSITYTLTLTNPGGTNASTAFDSLVRDVMPAHILITSITSTALAGGATTDSGAAITGGGTGLNGQYDIPVGGSVIITYTGTVQATAPLGSTLINSAEVMWTSLNGGNSLAPDTGERFGAAGTTLGDGSLNDYRLTDSTAVSVGVASFDKQLFSTSDAGTTGSNIAIGETVTYALVVSLPAGTAPSLSIVDTLPVGLQFVSSSLVTTAAGSGGLLSQNFGGTVPAPTVTGGAADGDDVTFAFGSITANADGNSANNTFLVLITARVTNIAGNEGILPGQTALPNSATFDIPGDGVPPGTPPPVTVTVVEPVLTIDKEFNVTQADAGDTVQITITVNNTGNGPSYDTLITDVVNTAKFGSITAVTTPAGFTFNNAAGTVTYSGGTIAAGGSATFVFSATLLSAVNPSETLSNTAGAFGTSQPGVVAGERTTPTVQDTDTLDVQTAFVLTKGITSPAGGSVQIGDIVTYSVNVTLIEGTTNNISLTDLLPAGTSYVAASAVVSNANGMTVNGFNAAIAGQTLTLTATSVVNPGNVDNTATADTDTFTITYQVVINDVAGNSSGTLLPNSLTGGGTGVPPSTPPPVNATVIEPALRVVKAVNDSSADLGQSLHFTLTINHTGASTATAYDLLVRDALPAGLSGLTGILINGVAVGSSPLVDTNSSTGSLLDLKLSQLAVGNTITVEFDATVGTAAALVGATIDNNARIYWDSQPTESANSVFTGVADGNGDRDYGATGANEVFNVDTQAAQDTERLTVNGSMLSGIIYHDANASGGFNAGDTGLVGESVTLTGTTIFGESINVTLATGAGGAYSFTNLAPGTYTLTETQPAGYLDAAETVGTTYGGTVSAVLGSNTISTLTIPAGNNSGAGYNFGEVLASTLSGLVYSDTNNDGVRQGGETLLNTNVQLTGTDFLGQAVSVTLGTTAGAYSFSNLRPGTYTLTETQVAGFFDGRETVGTQASGTVNNAVDSQTISAITLLQNVNGSGNNFAELAPSSLGGFVYADFDNDGVKDAVETGVPGATVTLTGTDDRGNVLTAVVTTTDALGAYNFALLRPGSYTITETQPADYTDGTDTQGTPGGGVVNNDQFAAIPLALAGTTGANNNFGEQPIFGLTKSLTATSSTGTSGNNLAIGERATFRLVVTIPAGGFTNFQIQDALPTGMQFVDGSARVGLVGVTSSTVTAPLGSITTPTVFLADAAVSNNTTTDDDTYASGTDIFFKIGNITNSDTTAAVEAIVIEFDAVVVNQAANVAGATLANTFDILFDRDGVPGPDPDPTPPSPPVTTTVVEPVLTLVKNASAAGTVSAGDVVSYTLTLTNTSTSTAFDALIADAMPTDIRITAIGVVTLNGGATTDSAVTITGGGAGLSGQFDIPAGGSVVINYTSTVQLSAPPGSTQTNNAALTWTSINGGNSLTPDAGERFGAPGTLFGDTNLNNYRRVDSETVTVGTATFDKDLFSTSDPATPGAFVAIGETVTYALSVTLPAGTAPSLTVLDALPVGLRYISSSIVTTVGAAAGFLAQDFNGTVPAPTISGGAADGDDVTFTFGSLTTAADGNPSNNTFLILVTARVTDIAGNEGILPGQTTLDNIATFDIPGDGVPPGTPPPVTVTVVEPVLTIDKEFNVTQADAGDTVQISIVVNNTGTGVAHDVVITDAVNLAKFGSITAVTTPAGFTFNNAAGTVTFTGGSIAAGSSATFIFSVVLGNGVNPSETLNNTATATATSQPGVVPGERSFGPVQDTDTLNVPAIFTLVKGLQSPVGGAVQIGDIVTYSVNVTLLEGTTNNITLTDLLPAGMSYIAGSAVVVNANGMTVNGFNAGAVGQTLTLTSTSVVNPGNVDNAATTDSDTFTITYQAVVNDVAGNVRGTLLANSLTGGGDGVPPGNPPPVNVTVTEPALTIAKLANDTTPDLGQVIRFTLTIQNPNIANGATAYDLLVRDALPAGLTNLTNITVVGATVDSNTSTSSLLDLKLSDLAMGATATIQFDATVGTAAALVGTNIDNNARLYWDTQPGESANSILTGAADGDGDRDFGAGTGTEVFNLNTDPAQDTERLTVNASSLSGFVYHDADASGGFNAGDSGLVGQTVTLTGTTAFGEAINIVGTTIAGGAYTFNNLAPGSYTLTETQPAGYIDGAETVGSTFGGTVSDAVGSNTISTLTIPVGNNTGTGYNFGEVLASTLSGLVYSDTNNDGIRQGGESTLDTNVQLTGTDFLGQAVNFTLGTTSGVYAFANLRPGTYTLTETQVAGFFDGRETVGTQASGTVNNLVDSQTISAITLPQNVNGSGNNFGELAASSLGGFVYVDAGNDGVRGLGETAVGGITITLTGTDDRGNAVSTTTTTNVVTGAYGFANLRPGTYTITETQPAGFLDGRDTQGTPGGGTLNNDQFAAIPLSLAGTSGTENNFGELRAATLAGFVYRDLDNDGSFEPGAGETGIVSTFVTLTGTNDLGAIAPVTIQTAGDGSYSFGNLRPGTYTVTETQPGGFLDGLDTAGSPGGGTAGNDVITNITLTEGLSSQNNNFGEIPAISISGNVYDDRDNDGVIDLGENGIGGVDIRLVGTNDLGASVDVTIQTLADGTYSFNGVRPGTYTVIQLVQPAGFLDGRETAGNFGGSTAVNDRIGSFVLPPSQNAVNYNFGELTPSTLAGFVFDDRNNNGLRDDGATGIGGATVTLTGTNDLGAVSTTILTNPDGSYSFGSLRPGTYTITETQPVGLLDGLDSIGTPGGNATVNDVFSGIVLAAAVNGAENNFGELTPSSISGTVYRDFNNDGLVTLGETFIGGVQISLTGTDDLGAAVSLTTSTNGSGNYSFGNLRPGNYVVTEVTQPAGLLDGTDTPGTGAGGSGGPIGSDTLFGLSLPSNTPAANYNFGELNPASLSGTVFADYNNDGILNGGETGIPGATVTLSGTNDIGIIVPIVLTTDANGNYAFSNLRPGTYAINESQPAGFTDGIDTVGTGLTAPNVAGNNGVNDVLGGIVLNSVAPGNNTGTGYNFAEAPQFSLNKTVAGTSEVGTTGSSVAVGEIVRYRLVVTIPTGTLSNAQLQDLIPAGLQFVGNAKVGFVGALTSSTITAPLASITTPTVDLTDAQISDNATTNSDAYVSGTDVFFKLGNLTNLDTNGATTEAIVIEFDARVLNESANIAGTTLTNDFRLLHERDTTPGPDPTPDVPPAPPAVTVVAPVLTFDKNGTPTGGLEAGSVITYTLTLTNPGGLNSSTAFDSLVNDVMPANILITSITGTTLNGGATADSAATITGGGTGLNGQYDIPVGASVTITYQGTIQVTVVPGSTLTNNAELTWTSINGGNSLTPDAGERFGAAGTLFGDANLNNYRRVDDLSVVVGVGSMTKGLFGTSDVGTIGSNVAIGEVVTFALTVTLPQGTTQTLNIVDQLPAGLQFVSSSIVTSAAASNGFLTANFNGTVNAPVVSGGALDGDDVSFVFSNIVANPDAIPGNSSFVLLVSARVTDIPANVSGATLDNVATYDDPNEPTPPTPTPPVRVNVVTPTLTIDKEFNVLQADAGDTVLVDITVNNTGTGPAYDVVVGDLVDLVKFGSITQVTTPAGFTFNNAGGNVTFTGGTIAVGGSATFTFSVRLNSAVNPSEILSNTATAFGTSQPGVVAGERTTPVVQDTDTLNVPAVFNLVKGLQSPVGGNVRIGDIVTYTVDVTLLEGTTNNISLTDLLPTGMSYLNGSAVVSNANGMTVNGFNAGAAGQTLTITATSIVNPGNVDNTATTDSDTFTITYQALVNDVAGNTAGTLLSNRLTGGGDGVPPGNPPPVDVRVTEPSLQVTKLANDNTLELGQTVRFTLTIENLNVANGADAFDILVRDALPAGLSNIANITVTGATIDENNSTIALLDLKLSSLALGATATVSFDATVGTNPLLVGTNIDNNARIFWDSQPGESTNTVLAGGTDGDNDRDYGATGPDEVFNQQTQLAQDTERVSINANTLSGVVYQDVNADGDYDAGTDTLLDGVLVTINGTLAADNSPFTATALTVGGVYTFNNLAAGTYTLTETQPVGYVDGGETVGAPFGGTKSDVLGSNTISGLVIPLGGGSGSGYNFGEVLGSSLAAAVYEDANNNGVRDEVGTGINGASVTFSGTDFLGQAVSFTLNTDASGNVVFGAGETLRPGTYTVRENAQPAGFLDGTDTDGSLGNGDASVNDVISSIELPQGTPANSYLFGELLAATISGNVYNDANNDGLFVGETGVGSVFVTLNGTNDLGAIAPVTIQTAADGSYSFGNLRPGTYTVTEAQPAGFLDGTDTAGAIGGGVAVNGATDSDAINSIMLTSGLVSAGNNFGEVQANSLSGSVYFDLDNDGVRDAGENGIAGVVVTLTGTDDRGNAINIPGTTIANGSYSFSSLRPGTYIITETQPALFNDGIDTLGTASGTLGNDVLSDIILVSGNSATGYLFGERGTTITGTVFRDVDKAGDLDAGTDPGIGGVTITLRDGSNNIVATTVTLADGSYVFNNVIAGNYTITETQPLGFGSSTPNALNVTVTTAGLADQNFGETLGSLTGRVFQDDNGDGIVNGADSGIVTTVTLTGTNALGQSVNITIPTNPDGTYAFNDLLSGTYAIRETQPAGFDDSADYVGSLGGSNAVNDRISAIAVTPGTDGVNYNFSELFAFNPTKTLVSTSNVGTTGSNVTIGEIVRYRLVITLPQGQLNDYVIADSLPSGMRFLDDGTVTLGLVSATGALVTSSTLGAAPGILSLADTSAFLLPPDAISNSANSDTDGWGSGTDVFFRLGNLTNNGADPAPEFAVVEFNAQVLNELPNQAGRVLSNTFTARYDTSGDGVNDPLPPSVVSRPVRTTVVEPILSLDKQITAGPATPKPGDVVTFTVVVRHAAGSNATAWESFFSDTLPNGMTLVNITTKADGGAVVTQPAKASGASITGQFDIPVNGSVTITYQVRIGAGIKTGTTLTNGADITWTSLPGDEPTERKSGDSLLNKGGLNDYELKAQASVKVNAPPPSDPPQFFWDGFNRLGYPRNNMPDSPFPYLPEDNDIYRLPILPLQPIYSGEADPGSTLVLTMYNARGEVIGSQTVVVDSGGNWLSTFPSTTMRDYPNTVHISQLSAYYSFGSGIGHNLRTYYSPAINAGQFFFQSIFTADDSEEAPLLADRQFANPINNGAVKYHGEVLASQGAAQGY